MKHTYSFMGHFGDSVHHWDLQKCSGTIRFFIITLRFILWTLPWLHPNWPNSKEEGVRQQESEHDVPHRGRRGATELTSVFLSPGGDLLQGHKVLPTVLLAPLILIQTKQPVWRWHHFKAYLKSPSRAQNPTWTRSHRASSSPRCQWACSRERCSIRGAGRGGAGPYGGFEPGLLLTPHPWVDLVGFLYSNRLVRPGGAWLERSAGRLRPVA